MPVNMAWASLSWCVADRSSASSMGLLMKAVSTRIDGMSGAFNTAKPACSTLGLCRRLIFLISFLVVLV